MKYENGLSKVPEVTLAFWVIKIAATTLGETGGDAVSMTLNRGYALSSAMFIGIFAIAVAAQIAARSFHPFLYRRRLPVPPWPTLPIALSVSDMPADH